MLTENLQLNNSSVMLRTAVSASSCDMKHKLHRFLHGHSGYLQKQGKVFQNWRQRYVVLEKRRLKCFTDKSCLNKLCDVLIDDTLVLYDVQDDSDCIKNLFYINARNAQGDDETLVFAAANEKDKQDWIEAIVDASHEGFRQIFQPDLWSQAFYPTVDMSVVYSKAGSVDSGNILRPLFLESPPVISLHGLGSDEKFCCIMLDADPICLGERGKTENLYLQWGIINFNGKDIFPCDVVSY
jgi:hypothetical protein